MEKNDNHSTVIMTNMHKNKKFTCQNRNDVYLCNRISKARLEIIHRLNPQF